MSEYKNLAEAFLDEGGKASVLRFVNKGRNIEIISLEDFRSLAKKYALSLIRQGVKKGTRIVIATSSFKDFLGIFWGGVIIGAQVIPVALSEDELDVKSHSAKRLNQIIEIADPKYVVENNGGNVEQVLSDSSLVISMDESELPNDIDELLYPEMDENDIAVIMFTSGTTAKPKGVPMTHKMILKSCMGINKRFGNNENSCFLNWLPLEHVGTLMLLHMTAMISHGSFVNVFTNEILEEPSYLLELINDYRVSMTFAPNFYYKLLMDQKADISLMDISLESLTVLINGSEMINYSLAADFIDLLGDKGLKKNAMKTAWGMTELSNPSVFGDSIYENMYEGKVSCGTPIEGISLRIVKDSEIVNMDDVEGSLQVKGDMVFRGYINESAEEHTSRFTEDGWFRTGDLALFHNGALIISGRETQIFILNGVNYSIAEIESAISDELSTKYGNVIVKVMTSYNSSNYEDELYGFVELKDDVASKVIVNEVKNFLLDRYGFCINNLYALPYADMPKTVVGKLDGKKLIYNAREGFYDDRDDSCKHEQISDEENLILFIWADTLGINKNQLSVEDDFFALGGNSAKVPYALKKINTSFNCDLNAAQFVKYSTPRALLNFINSEIRVDDSFEEDDEEVIII